jgi:hypothetical protein
VAPLTLAVARFEARAEEEASDRLDLREQVLDFRRRLGALEERVQELEGRLPRD